MAKEKITTAYEKFTLYLMSQFCEIFRQNRIVRFTFAGNKYIHIDIIQLSKLLNNDPTCANTNFHDLPQAIDI